MQILHVPSSLYLSFQNVKSHEDAGLISSYEKPLQSSTAVFCSLQQQRHERSQWVHRRGSVLSSLTTKAASLEDAVGADEILKAEAEKDVLKALSQIIDPDFGTDIVSCGFVKDLDINDASGEVSFRLELTTPACPIKDMFEPQANEVVNALPWVKNVSVTMSAQPAKPIYAGQLPSGLQMISNIIAVSSCKGGVGKSTVAVDLAYTLAGMGARVGIFDADVYGPSLPTMVSPENRILVMNPGKKTIIPAENLGVKLVSFGFARQGRAIMRGPKVVQQFGIPNLFDLPIRPTLSASGDSGTPEVVADPLGEVSKTFQGLGICVVQQCAKIRQQVSTAVMYDKSIRAIRVKVPDSDEEFLLHPATVRQNDRSAQSVDEWTGEQKLQFADVPEDIEPEEIRPMGNYAVSITWSDGFSQIAPYDQLQTIERLVDVPRLVPYQASYHSYHSFSLHQPQMHINIHQEPYSCRNVCLSIIFICFKKIETA
ncbi:hypothetical protein ACFX13_026944 [Malus domestica]